MKDWADVPLTKFQLKVLKATTKIPMGETRSYKWVAARIGQPQASRAVGQALRRNPFPIVVPCHRVIHTDGKPGGYAGGPSAKKEKLQQLERDLLLLNSGKQLNKAGQRK